jgi:Secretion system C-terminal sorting domain
MKQIYTLLVAIVFSTTIHAQSTSTAVNLLQQKKFIHTLLQSQQNNSSNRSVASQRVIGQSTYDNVMSSKVDSVKLLYGLNGTSTYDFNMLLFPYNYPYNSTPLFNYLGVFAKPQILAEKYDHWTINPNTLIYGFFEKNIAKYDVNKNLIKDTALFADSALIPNMTYANTFNAANNIDAGYSYNYHAGVSSNSFKQFFKYDAFNKLTNDSIYAYHAGTWHLASKTVYSYDASNNLVLIDNYSNTTDTTYTSALVHQLQYANTFDASNRLLTVQTSYFDGTAFTIYVQDTFAYTGASTFHTSWKEHQYDAINGYWAPMTYMSKTLNGAGFPDVINIQTFDSLANAWVPSMKQLVMYDASNNPTQLDQYDYNFIAFPLTPDFSTYYYYETFTNTTGINNLTKASNTITVFPNPSSSSITIAGMNHSLQKGFVMFYDTQGRKVKEQTFLSLNTLETISIDDLQPSIYLMVIADENKIVQSTHSVVKVNQ